MTLSRLLGCGMRRSMHSSGAKDLPDRLRIETSTSTRTVALLLDDLCHKNTEGAVLIFLLR